jgi:hypothetical protein
MSELINNRDINIGYADDQVSWANVRTDPVAIKKLNSKDEITSDLQIIKFTDSDGPSWNNIRYFNIDRIYNNETAIKLYHTLIAGRIAYNIVSQQVCFSDLQSYLNWIKISSDENKNIPINLICRPFNISSITVDIKYDYVADIVARIVIYNRSPTSNGIYFSLQNRLLLAMREGVGIGNSFVPCHDLFREDNGTYETCTCVTIRYVNNVNESIITSNFQSKNKEIYNLLRRSSRNMYVLRLICVLVSVVIPTILAAFGAATGIDMRTYSLQLAALSVGSFTVVIKLAESFSDTEISIRDLILGKLKITSIDQLIDINDRQSLLYLFNHRYLQSRLSSKDTCVFPLAGGGDVDLTRGLTTNDFYKAGILIGSNLLLMPNEKGIMPYENTNSGQGSYSSTMKRRYNTMSCTIVHDDVVTG